MQQTSPASRMPRRLAAALALVALAAWPMRDALFAGKVAGAGPDVAVTLWGMWWFSQEWLGAAWAGATSLVNFPDGATGSVLSPMTAAIFSLLQPIFGPAAASTLTCVAYLSAMAACVAWLGRLSGLSPVAALAAGALALAGRYLVFAIGETSLVGITALPALVGLGALLTRRLILFAACTGLTGLEFPYLVPLLPCLGLLASVRDRRVLLPTLAGAVLAALAAAMVGRGQENTFALASLAPPLRGGWTAVEADFSRAQPLLLLWPTEPRWSLSAVASVGAGGREYLGASVLLAAVLGVVLRPRQAGPWFALGLLGVAMALGSDWFGFPGPFALLNGVAMRVIRGLSQPTRYLVLTVGFAIAAAHAFDALRPRLRWPLAGLLAADAFLFGGLSLRMPAMDLPTPACVVALDEGGVIAWPWDGRLQGESTIRTRLWQIAHGQPGVGLGVGSWRLGGDRPVADRLRLAEAVEGRGPADTDTLYRLGYRWVVADPSPGDWSLRTARAALGEPAATCDGVEVFALTEGMPRRMPPPGIAPPRGWTGEQARPGGQPEPQGPPL